MYWSILPIITFIQFGQIHGFLGPHEIPSEDISVLEMKGYNMTVYDGYYYTAGTQLGDGLWNIHDGIQCSSICLAYMDLHPSPCHVVNYKKNVKYCELRQLAKEDEKHEFMALPHTKVYVIHGSEGNPLIEKKTTKRSEVIEKKTIKRKRKEQKRYNEDNGN